MTDKHTKKPDDAEIGEGSYEGAREYDEKAAAFVRKQGEAGIEAKAREAEQALAGSQGAELAAAEARGRSKART